MAFGPQDTAQRQSVMGGPVLDPESIRDGYSVGAPYNPAEAVARLRAAEEAAIRRRLGFTGLPMGAGMPGIMPRTPESAPAPGPGSTVTENVKNLVREIRGVPPRGYAKPQPARQMPDASTTTVKVSPVQGGAMAGQQSMQPGRVQTAAQTSGGGSGYRSALSGLRDAATAAQDSERQYIDKRTRIQEEVDTALDMQQQSALRSDESAKLEAIEAQRDRDLARKGLESAREAARGWKEDPGRFIRNMPTYQKVMVGLGSALGAYVEARSGGAIKNTFAGYLESAIDRDLQSQRVQYQRLLRSVDMSADDVARATQRFDKSLAAKRDAAVQVAKIAAMRQAQQIGTADAIRDAEKFIAGVEERFQAARLSAASKQAAARANAAAAEAASAKKLRDEAMKLQKHGRLSSEDSKTVFAISNGLEFVDLIKKQIAKEGYNKAGKWVPLAETAAKRIAGRLATVAAGRYKALVDNSVLQEKEYHRAMEAFDPTTIENLLMSDPSHVVGRLDLAKQDFITGAKSLMRAREGSGYEVGFTGLRNILEQHSRPDIRQQVGARVDQ